ncbi:hypothetical protein [Paraburkholderia sp. GAS42]|uniref:hypothetical protein n=1 Tax=Paraburkholderia sp. GAS42 TaxID=3035135 RepID=UPI003D1E70A0
MPIMLFALAAGPSLSFAEELLRADGGHYKGQVSEGKAEGQGVETRPDGTILKGRFVRDVFVEGTMRTGGWVVPFSNCHSLDTPKPSQPANK